MLVDTAPVDGETLAELSARNAVRRAELRREQEKEAQEGAAAAGERLWRRDAKAKAREKAAAMAMEASDKAAFAALIDGCVLLTA
jgi:hypothetical protein